MIDEGGVLQYVGHFMGFQPKGSGTKKDGSPWTSFDVMFHHGDMTRPVRFTWFEKTVGDIAQFMPGTVYRVMYRMNHFTTESGEERKAKTAFAINPSTQGEQLGYQQQQQTVNPAATTQTQPQTLADFDMVGFVKSYKDKYSPSDWNPYHFIVTVELTKTPGKKDMFLSYKEAFNSKVMGK